MVLKGSTHGKFVAEVEYPDAEAPTTFTFSLAKKGPSPREVSGRASLWDVEWWEE